MLKRSHYLYLLSLLSLLLIGTSTVAHAQVSGTATSKKMGIESRLEALGNNTDFKAVTENSFPQAVGLIIRVSLALIGVFFMCYIVYAGWLWLTAAGEEGPIDKAKDIIRGSIIALFIVGAAYVITAVAISQFAAIGQVAPQAPADPLALPPLDPNL